MPETYLVTGCSRGLGLEFARQLKARGDRVLGVLRTQTADARAACDRVFSLDVTSPDALSRLQHDLADERVDVLINNAGVSSESRTLDLCTADELQRVFLVNATAPVMVVKAVLPALRRGPRRLVVNISSQLASITNNSGGSSYAYRASKCALNMLTTCLANEFRPDAVAFVAMHPGWVRTDMGGPKAPLSPPESVRAMLATIGGPDGTGLGMSRTGSFLNYDGSPLPW
ncbi:MAG: SDR family oxidoreductase [Planctomycetota bacterium]|nr:SDR family oxidoreductase [Planctomycetota bacterium]